MLRRPVIVAAFFSALSSTTSGEAQQPPREARLEYTRGPGAGHCPLDEEIRSAVSGRLGYQPFRSDAATTVSARITRSGSVLRADVELRDASGSVVGTRQLRSKQNDCTELVGAMTLAISLAIDPQSQTRPAPAPVAAPPTPPRGAVGGTGPAGTPSGGPPAPATAPPTAPPPPDTAPPPLAPPSPPPDVRALPARSSRLDVGPRNHPVIVFAGAGAMVVAGSAPRPTIGFAGQLGARWGWASVALEGRGDLAASQDDPASGGSVDASLLLASLVPCWHRNALFVCGLGSVGLLRGSGDNVRKPLAAATLFGEAGVRLGLEIPLATRFSAVVHGDLTAITTPTTLRLEGNNVWTTAPLSAAVGLGGQAHFP